MSICDHRWTPYEYRGTAWHTFAWYCAECEYEITDDHHKTLLKLATAQQEIADLKAKYDIEAKRSDRLSDLLKKQTQLNAQILTQIGAGKEDLAEYIARHERLRAALERIANPNINTVRGVSVNIAREALGKEEV